MSDIRETLDVGENMSKIRVKVRNFKGEENLKLIFNRFTKN